MIFVGITISKTIELPKKAQIILVSKFLFEVRDVLAEGKTV